MKPIPIRALPMSVMIIAACTPQIGDQSQSTLRAIGQNAVAQSGAPISVSRSVGLKNSSCAVESSLLFSSERLNHAGWAQSCPTGSGYQPLSETLPVAGVILAAETKKSYEDWPLTKKLLDLFGVMSPSPHLNLLVSRDALSSVQKRIVQLFPATTAELINLIPIAQQSDAIPSLPALWKFGLGGVERANFTLQVLSGNEAAAASLGTQVANECKMKLENATPFLSDAPGDTGENLLTFPGGITAAGVDLSEDLLDEFVPENFGQIVRMNNQWLKSAHLSEIVMPVVTNDPAPCNFALLQASPRDGLLLAQEIAELDDDRLEPVWPKQEQIERDKDVARSGCLQRLSRARWGRPLGANEALSCPAFVKANETYESIITAEVARLAAAVAKSTSCTNVKVIPIPHLYIPNVWEATDSFGKESDQAESLIPNMVAGVVLDRTFLTLDPTLELFRRGVKETLKKNGIQTEFVDKISFHLEHSGLYGGLQTIRSCVAR